MKNVCKFVELWCWWFDTYRWG